MDASGWGAIGGAVLGYLSDEAKQRDYNRKMGLAATMLRTSPWSGIVPHMPASVDPGAGLLSGALSGFQAGNQYLKQSNPKIEAPSADAQAMGSAAEDQISQIGNPAPMQDYAKMAQGLPDLQKPAFLTAPALAPRVVPAAQPAYQDFSAKAPVQPIGPKVSKRPTIPKSGVTSLGAQGGAAEAPYYLNANAPSVRSAAPQIPPYLQQTMNPWDFKVGGY